MTYPALISELSVRHDLTAEQYRLLLEDTDQEDNALLQERAREVSRNVFGNRIYFRGLIEISNHCHNNCYYCGIRAGNNKLKRYRLSKEEILECCRKGYELGFRTFVLQGGEDPAQTDEWLEEVIKSIRKAHPDCAITLSLGEKSPESYRLLRQAGADRYLLRHETFNQEHYARLHPREMLRERRLCCLKTLKGQVFQTGTGIMVGSPYQTTDNIVEDILYIKELRPEMIGIGPFIHHGDTPFAGFPDGSVELTLKLISIFRLMFPGALIPATTSLATLSRDGRRRGILAGANVVMPNLSPPECRKDYALYDDKAAYAAESAEGLQELREELRSIGYELFISRGDYRNV